MLYSPWTQWPGASQACVAYLSLENILLTPQLLEIQSLLLKTLRSEYLL